jgi:NhaA family Na+:H+ antiporter
MFVSADGRLSTLARHRLSPLSGIGSRTNFERVINKWENDGVENRSLPGPTSLIAEFLRLEAAAGLVLMAATAAALVLANSPMAPLYQAVLSAEIGLPGNSLSVLLWINDGLMVIFFLLIGLEIKRELLVGELSSTKRAVLPAIAALGGMIVPAMIYAALNWHDPDALRGWAIPAATDIAFALGVVAILGSRVPTSLKVFLTALAILDDLGAIVIIGLFYTPHVSGIALGLAAASLALLLALNRFGVRRLAPYLIVGLFVWGVVLASGVHGTLAGVAVAFMVPMRGPGATEEDSPLHRLEHKLHPWVVYGILPIFGLANAGLSFSGLSLADLLAPVSFGIAAGLFIGKQVGVMAAAWTAVKMGWAEWPDGSSAGQIYGIAVLCGIGFTMSLFIGGLAFSSDDLQIQAKLGVFGGSLISALVGFLVLRFSGPQRS